GQIEQRPDVELSLFQRAVELNPRFEVAQFELAASWEMIWRTRPTFEPGVAGKILEEYRRALDLNASDMSAWANTGYMHWLLGDLENAVKADEGGLKYKEIKRETFTAELDYGLARIVAERGDFASAYTFYRAAITAHIAQGVSHGLAAESSYQFDL